MYAQMNTQLSDFPRAVTVAQGYQHYRITNVKLKFKSPYDTYINMGPQGTGAYQKPYFYYMLDKSGSVPNNVSLEGLKGMGAKPRALDEKAIVISWKPSVLEFTGTQNAGGIGLPNKYKLSPWLATGAFPSATTWAPSTVDHLGVYWGIFAALAGVADPIKYDAEIEVQFEFKGPLTTAAQTSDTPALTLAPATLNRSPDGIVGGPDGV